MLASSLRALAADLSRVVVCIPDPGSLALGVALTKEKTLGYMVMMALSVVCESCPAVFFLLSCFILTFNLFIFSYPTFYLPHTISLPICFEKMKCFSLSLIYTALHHFLLSPLITPSATLTVYYSNCPYRETSLFQNCNLITVDNEWIFLIHFCTQR